MEETRIYKISGLPRQIKEFEQILSYMCFLGNIGHSTEFKIFVDGDGSARLSITDEKGTKILDVNNNRNDLKNKMNSNYNVKGFCIE